jgi:hypothetical protein
MSLSTNKFQESKQFFFLHKLTFSRSVSSTCVSKYVVLYETNFILNTINCTVVSSSFDKFTNGSFQEIN